MATDNTGESLLPPETETSRVNPINKFDESLFETATIDFKDNPDVQKALRNISTSIIEQARQSAAYFRGEADERTYEGVDKSLLRPTSISPTFGEGLKLGPNLSRQAIAKRLGVDAEDLEKTNGWDINYSRKSGSIGIPLENIGDGEPPRVHIAKDYAGIIEPNEPGSWSIGLYFPSKTYNTSLDIPIAQSRFTPTLAT